MLTLTKYSSICLSACKAERSTPTTLYHGSCPRRRGGAQADSPWGRRQRLPRPLNSASPSASASAERGQQTMPAMTPQTQAALKEALVHSCKPFNHGRQLSIFQEFSLVFFPALLTAAKYRVIKLSLFMSLVGTGERQTCASRDLAMAQGAPPTSCPAGRTAWPGAGLAAGFRVGKPSLPGPRPPRARLKWLPLRGAGGTMFPCKASGRQLL